VIPSFAPPARISTWWRLCLEVGGEKKSSNEGVRTRKRKEEKELKTDDESEKGNGRSVVREKRARVGGQSCFLFEGG